jgi:hypothetical protein
MAEIIASGKVIHIDDEDFDLVKDHKWRSIQNVSGHIARRLPNGRSIGLAATLIGKRPSKMMHLEFRDKDLRNFSKANVYWTDACYYCGRPMTRFLGMCAHCQEDFNINSRCTAWRVSLMYQPTHRYSNSVD